MDLAGKWMTSALGNIYLLMLQDYHSKLMYAAPLKDTKTKTICVELEKLFTTHGIPKTIVCGRGPQFEGSEFKEFAKSKNFKLEYASDHQTNGLIERGIRTIEAMIRTTCENRKLGYRSQTTS